MFLRRLSIQWKITLLAGLCLLGVVALLVGLSVYRMQHSSVLVKSASTQMLDESARLRLEARGELQALRIQRYFMDAFQYGKGFSRQILFLRDQAQKRFLDAYDLREDLTRQVRTALAANPEVLGLYVVFEPNALDGKDELFVDQPALGSNDKGRFSLYWAQATPGQLESESMIESELADTSSGPSGAAYNAWYTCPKESGQPCVLDPYFDKVGERQLLMTSIAFPLELDGKVIGVMGLDINLSNLQALSEQGNRELYDGVGQVGILSPAGLFAGNSRDAGLLGKNLVKADPQHAGELLQLLAAGKSRLFNENDDLKVLQPLQPIPGAKPWGVLLEVPKSALLGPALALERQLDDMRREGTWVELGLGLGAAVLGLLLLFGGLGLGSFLGFIGLFRLGGFLGLGLSSLVSLLLFRRFRSSDLLLFQLLLLEFLLLELLLFELLDFVLLGGGLLRLASDLLVGLCRRLALRLELVERGLHDRLGGRKLRSKRPADEQHGEDQNVQDHRQDDGPEITLGRRAFELLLQDQGASVINPTLGTPACCKAPMAPTTAP